MRGLSRRKLEGREEHERSEIRAVEMVRRIRDEQTALVAGKSEAEVLEFFRKAGEARVW